MNVPGDFVEDCDERVDRDEADARFDETTGEEAALAEAGHAVTFADFFGFFSQVERFTGAFAGHEAEGRGEVRVHEIRAGTRLETFHRAFNRVAKRLAALEARFA